MRDGRRGDLALGPLGEEVGEDLRLDGVPWGVADREPHELYPPLGDAPRRLGAVDDLAEGEFRHYGDWVRLEVVPELPLTDEHSVEELLDLRVADLGVGEDFADEVHGPLHSMCVPFFLSFDHDGSANRERCRCDVEEERLLGSRGGEDWRDGQEPLEGVEGHLCLVVPGEVVRLLQ
jgi:hypothetical protein